MRKYTLMAGVAAATLAVVPGTAIAQELSGSASIDYANNIDTSVVTDISYTKDVNLRGTVRMDGEIEVDSSAVAVIDNKQLLLGNEVSFREETNIGAAEDDPGTPNIDESLDDDLSNGAVDEVFEETGEDIAIGYFAPIVNTTSAVNLTNAEGNIGVNVAAGYTNQQENVAAIASSDFDGGGGGGGEGGNQPDFGDAGGWAEASLTAAQGSTGNFYGPNDTTFTDENNPEMSGNDYRDRNTTGAVAVTNGTGNLGLNVAAGAFNQQKNALAIAVATNASLAEASAAVIQASGDNETVAMDSQNVVGVLTVGGNEGNVGINVAAGVGNQQMNSLTIASSSGMGAGTGGEGGGGGAEGG
jgi:hypothetical protein